MSRRKLLVSLLTVTVVAGLLFVAKPFVWSLNPSANAGATLPHIDISDLEPGEYRYHNSEGRGWLEVSWLIIRNYSGEIYVYAVPRHKGKYFMPDITWFRWGGLCDEFAPEVVNGKLKENGVSRCYDEGIGEWASGEWRWSLDGKNLGNYTSDMERTRFAVEGKHLIVGKY